MEQDSVNLGSCMHSVVSHKVRLVHNYQLKECLEVTAFSKLTTGGTMIIIGRMDHFTSLAVVCCPGWPHSLAVWVNTTHCQWHVQAEIQGRSPQQYLLGFVNNLHAAQPQAPSQAAQC